MPVSRLVDDTRYISWPITAPASLVIIGDAAQVCFRSGGLTGPQTIFYAAQITVDSVRYPDGLPRFRFLLGTGAGGITPGAGRWAVLGKISDNPETPLLELDTLVLRS